MLERSRREGRYSSQDYSSFREVERERERERERAFDNGASTEAIRERGY